MDEADNRMEADGKGLFIIRNGQKVAKYEAGKWVPLLSSVTHPMTLKLKSRTRPCVGIFCGNDSLFAFPVFDLAQNTPNVSM
jgi:hypothetical protein